MEPEDRDIVAIKDSVMVYYTECGFANERGNTFCSQYGSPLERPEANPAAPASPEPLAGRPDVDHAKAVMIVLIALTCVVTLVIGLFITRGMGLWGAQPQARTSAQSTGADALDPADDGTTGSSDTKSKAKKNTSDNTKDKNSNDSSKKSSTGKLRPSILVITSNQLFDIADSYSSSDMAISAMVTDKTSAGSSKNITITTTSQSGEQFMAADFYLPIYLTAQDNGDDNVKTQTDTMMGSIDTAMPTIW